MSESKLYICVYRVFIVKLYSKTTQLIIIVIYIYAI